jgi:hypothetical protein
VRVPATFALSPVGGLTPNSVSAPAFLAVQVTVVSHDARRHSVVVRTPTSYRFTVAPHGRGGVLIRGQRAGQYPVVIDGRTRAMLMIGGEPGP